MIPMQCLATWSSWRQGRFLLRELRSLDFPASPIVTQFQRAAQSRYCIQYLLHQCLLHMPSQRSLPW